MLQEVRDYWYDHSERDRILENWARVVEKYPYLLLAVPRNASVDSIRAGSKRYKPAEDLYWDALLLLYWLGAAVLPYSELMAALEAFLAFWRDRVAAASKKLIFGKMPILRWERSMRQAVLMAHGAAGVLASGGFASITEAEWGVLEKIVGQQMALLDRFKAQILSGQQPLDGRLLVRARMYVDAARGTHEEIRRGLFAQRGYKEERRVLGVAEHCPDCLAYAALGWQPIGTLPPIGDSACKTNCHCHFEYR